MPGVMMDEAFIAEISAFMSATATALEEGREPIEEISSSLVSMVMLMESKASSTAELVAAMRALRIEAVINVSPTPLNITPVVQLITQSTGFKATFKYDGHDRVAEAIFMPIASPRTTPRTDP